MIDTGVAPGDGAEEWQQVDRALRQLARSRAQRDFEEGRWLLAARRTEVHRHLGYASLPEYVERVLGYDARTTHDRLRVAEALEVLPATSAALEAGALLFSAVRELTRVATVETEGAWLEAARGRTARQVQGMVSGRRPGDLPGDPVDPAWATRVVRLSLRPEALALYREAVARLRREVDPRLSEEEALVEMARRVLGGPGDSGRAPYQVAVTRCDDCERVWQRARGEAVEVSAEVAERARCDGQEVPDGPGGGRRARQAVPPAVRRGVVRRDGGRCRVPGCRNATWLEVHHLRPVSEGGTNDPDGLVLLCGAHHRLQHQGYLWVEGETTAEVRFLHADGTPYEQVASPPAVEAGAEAFTRLRRLGVGEQAARRSIRKARAHVGTGAPAEALVRWALTRDGVTPSRPP